MNTRTKSDALRAAAVADYIDHVPLKVIYERYGIGVTTLWRWTKKSNRRLPRLDRNSTDMISDAYEAGESIAAIARRMGWSHSTIDRALRLRGVEKRPRASSNKSE